MLGKIKNFWHRLGPGLITGAADDDPSGIVTYSFAGAKFGLGALWTVLGTLPFMIIVQRMSGRIGLVSGKGLAGNMKRFYPKWIIISVALIILTTNIINIGADISAMSVAFNTVVPATSPILFSVIISTSVVLALIFFSYRRIASYLKWVAMIMLSYVLASFLIQQNWFEVIKSAIIPQITLNRDYILMVAAVFGTTISPYLFFWQAS